MADRVSKDWNLVQILASTSHVLHRVTIHDEEGFVATMVDAVTKCRTVLEIGDNGNEDNTIKQLSAAVVSDLCVEKGKEKKKISVG